MSGLSCPDQKLQSYTTDQFSVINKTVLRINESGNIEFKITDGIKKDRFYSTNVSVVNSEDVVQNSKLLNFSKAT